MNKFAGIAQTVNGWFDLNIDQTKRRNPVTQLDLRIFSVLLLARKHSNGIMSLLDLGHLLCAKALLRVLLELLIKFLWCMGVDPNQKDAIYQRFRRWDFSRLDKQKRQVSELDIDKFPQKKDTLNNIEQMINDLRSQGVASMPNVANIFGHFSSDWKRYVYAEQYLNYCMATHSDFRILHELVQYNKNMNQINYSS